MAEGNWRAMKKVARKAALSVRQMRERKAALIGGCEEGERRGAWPDDALADQPKVEPWKVAWREVLKEGQFYVARAKTLIGYTARKSEEVWTELLKETDPKWPRLAAAKRLALSGPYCSYLLLSGVGDSIYWASRSVLDLKVSNLKDQHFQGIHTAFQAVVWAWHEAVRGPKEEVIERTRRTLRALKEFGEMLIDTAVWLMNEEWREIIRVKEKEVSGENERILAGVERRSLDETAKNGR